MTVKERRRYRTLPPVYPVWFPSARLHAFVRTRLTPAMLGLQTGHVSAHVALQQCRDPSDGSLPKDILNTGEKVMRAILPGLSRLQKEVSSRHEVACLFATARKYVGHCVAYGEPVSFARILDVVNYDVQRGGSNRVPFQVLCRTGVREYAEAVQGRWPSSPLVLDAWPTPPAWSRYLRLVCTLSHLAHTNTRDRRTARHTVDPLEAVLGSFHLLGYSGLEGWMPWGGHDLYVPRLKELCRPGYMLALNKLNSLPDGSRCHKEGLKNIHTRVLQAAEAVLIN
jgi:hypothetical protein